MDKPLVIYHAGCWDGFCAAWIAKKALGDADFHAAQYGTDPPDVAGRVVYMLDFSYPREVMNRVAGEARRLVVLDHHKTSQEALDGLHEPESGIDVWFAMDRSGGRLAWEWFWDACFARQAIDDRFWPLAVRRDRAPWLVDYTEDRDLWRHALPETEAINAALRSHPLDFDLWDMFAGKDPISTLAYEGRAIRRRERQIVEDHIRHAREREIDGHQVLVVNATVMFSEIAGELALGRAFGACYFDRSDGKRQWSLRSEDSGVDVSAIAKAHGGGGHVHASGFEEAI